MGDQDGLATLGKEHEVRFPMPWPLPVLNLCRALTQRAPMLDDIDHAATETARTAALVLGPRQQAMPVILLGGAVIDEAVD
ncbi:hypothetical protein IH86_06995 [Sphingobium yanoikuyae]|nr:hypothetical protein IH86_06995 [Sphingobium yanoikuyae]KZC81423.1 hypothetical protein AYR46_06645 [Sphingobium yanoikuyae]